MQRYFFDVFDGETYATDPSGTDLESFGDALDTAIALIPDIAEDISSPDTRSPIQVRVRDQGGFTLFEANLTIRIFTCPRNHERLEMAASSAAEKAYALGSGRREFETA